MSKPKVWYLPVASHTQQVFRRETYERLLRRFDVTVNETEKNYTSEEIAAGVAEFEALVTGWGCAPITPEVMDHALHLKIIAHSAGSVRVLVRQVVESYLIPRNICVFSANEAIALNVAEYTVGLMIAATRRVFDLAAYVRETTGWRHPEISRNRFYLRGSTVGIVSASKVGREVIRLLQPFDVTILVYDPYLSEWDAGRLGVYKADLDELFRVSDIVSLHAPSLPETWGMVGAEQLRQLKDGALLVNTSRGKVIDHDALLAEAQTGRILVVLDVTDPEPLPGDHPLRKLPNVLITPHTSGTGNYGYFRIGDMTLQALEDFFAEKPVYGAVPLDRFAQLA